MDPTNNFPGASYPAANPMAVPSAAFPVAATNPAPYAAYGAPTGFEAQPAAAQPYPTPGAMPMAGMPSTVGEPSAPPPGYGQP